MRRALIGDSIRLPPDLTRRWPEFEAVDWRVGGLAVRVAGWPLGLPSAAAITLWRTVFLAPSTVLTPHLLLHELRHVQHFSESPLFPFRYLWESLRRGYARNRYELDADAWADARLEAGAPSL